MPRREPLYPHIPKSRKVPPPETPPGSFDIRPGDLVKTRVWGTIEYPWLTVKSGPHPTSWMGKQVNEYTVTDGLTENNVFEDTIFDHISKHRS